MPKFTKGYRGQFVPTKRELEVLSWAAQGVSSKEMAHRSNCTTSTIKSHFTGLLRKLNAKDRTQALFIAIRQGWIDWETGRPREVVVVLVPAGYPPVEVLYLEDDDEVDPV